MANGWGDCISPGMLRPPASSQHSSWTWPPEILSHSDWAIWATFLKDSLHPLSRYFIVPLGPWLHCTHCLDFVPFQLSTKCKCPGTWTILVPVFPCFHLWLLNHQNLFLSTHYGLPPSTDHLAQVESSHTQSIVLFGLAVLSYLLQLHCGNGHYNQLTSPIMVNQWLPLSLQGWPLQPVMGHTHCNGPLAWLQQSGLSVLVQVLPNQVSLAIEPPRFMACLQ